MHYWLVIIPNVIVIVYKLVNVVLTLEWYYSLNANTTKHFIA